MSAVSNIRMGEQDESIVRAFARDRDFAAAHNALAVNVTVELDSDVRRRARLVVAGAAHSADDCWLLLAALGLLEGEA